MNIFKVEYDWCEGEHSETLVAKQVAVEEFEKDLIKAKDFANSLKGKKVERTDYLGKGYVVECLPEFYHQIIWFLVNKLNYIECSHNTSVSYVIDDDLNHTIELVKKESNINYQEI